MGAAKASKVDWIETDPRADRDDAVARLASRPRRGWVLRKRVTPVRYSVAVRYVFLIGLVTSLGLGCVATGPGVHNCTAVGCNDGLHVAVTPNSGWPHGTYRFDIEADGETTTCTGDLPLPPCGTPALACEGPAVSIGESGCALPATEHAFADLHFDETPTKLRIDIDLDQTQITSQTWSPEYATLQPNGPSCEPTCRSATVDLIVQFPL